MQTPSAESISACAGFAANYLN